MNLLGIIGSPRKMGNCELMVEEIAVAMNRTLRLILRGGYPILGIGVMKECRISLN